MKILLAVSIFLAVAAISGRAQEKLSYADLVQRLYDLEHLALQPQPGEKTGQFSSYDRASEYDEKTGKYVHWDANGDGGGFIRKEGNQYVFAEMEGPGCLWRIWSAAPKQGHVRIYLDGATNPAVDLPFAEYFSGQAAPFTRSALVHKVAQGCNNYTPIPYQKSCKIVAEEGWGDYFEFGYTMFPAGTTVPTFQRELAAPDDAALDQANEILSHCGPREFPTGHAAVSGAGLLGSAETARLDGPQAITGFRVKFDPPLSPADHDVLREITLSINWDGERSPSVWTPLGDFFGTAPGANAYRSLPCGYTEDGWFYANWFMPFTKSAAITFRNEGKTERRFRYEIYTHEIKGDLDRYARFHAKWHRDEFLPTQPDRRIDWPLLKTTGLGRYVGVMLHVWNLRGGWWGEGDEKLFVDGEKFPSTFGTGSEDYFGYAWCNPTPFQNAFHNQTRNDGNNKGHVSVNRWHIADQVPFHASFEGDIEKYYSNARPTLYAATVFWYLAPGGNDPYLAQPLADRVGYWVRPERKTSPGWFEGEELKVTAKTGGAVQEQDLLPFGEHWSNDAQLWWTGAQPADRIELGLSVAKPARYQVSAQFTKAPDYGIVAVALDGEEVRDPIDLYDPNVVPSGEISLGVRQLNAGEHRLTLTIKGANPKALPRYMVGLDYVRLVEAK